MFQGKKDPSKGGHVAHVGDTCPKYKKGKKSQLREISPKIIFFWKRYRETEREGGEGGGRKESFGDLSGFIGWKLLNPELKFLVSTRATRRHQKEEISPKIQKRRFEENQSLRIRKSFEVS